MHMQIDETRHDPFALSIHDLGSRRQTAHIASCHYTDLAFHDQNISLIKKSVFRINNCPLPDQQRIHRHLRNL